MERRELFAERPILESIFKLALPSILGQVVLVIYNLASTLFVGLTNNDAMITAVSISAPLFMILSAISNLFGIGGSSLMARFLGKHDHKKARYASSFAIYGNLIGTILYIGLSFIFLDKIIDLVGGMNAEVHYHAKQYLISTVIIGGTFTTFSGVLAHLLRAEGKGFQSSFGLIASGIINVGLHPLFMFVILPKGEEVLGAGLATLVANILALIYYISYICSMKEGKIISFRLSSKTFNKYVVKNTLLVGLPAFLMTTFENISYTVLDALMFKYGVPAQAGLGVAKKINMLAHAIVRGMSQGVLPLIAYNYSDGKRQRMKNIVFVSGSINIIIATICMIVNLVLPYTLVSLFIGDGESTILGAKFLKLLTLGAPFSAGAYSIISFFQGVGKSFKSTILALLRKGILDIPLMFILNKSSQALCLPTPIADLVCFIIALILFFTYLKYHSVDKLEKKEDYIIYNFIKA